VTFGAASLLLMQDKNRSVWSGKLIVRCGNGKVLAVATTNDQERR
jgi:hypothetical protein